MYIRKERREDRWNSGVKCKNENDMDCPGGPWLRNHLPMQGTGVQSLVWGDSTWHATVQLSPSTTTVLSPPPLEPVLCNREASVMTSPHTTTKSSPCWPQLEEFWVHSWLSLSHIKMWCLKLNTSYCTKAYWDVFNCSFSELFLSLSHCYVCTYLISLIQCKFLYRSVYDW